MRALDSRMKATKLFNDCIINTKANGHTDLVIIFMCTYMCCARGIESRDFFAVLPACIEMDTIASFPLEHWVLEDCSNKILFRLLRYL